MLHSTPESIRQLYAVPFVPVCPETEGGVVGNWAALYSPPGLKDDTFSVLNHFNLFPLLENRRSEQNSFGSRLNENFTSHLSPFPDALY
jgi:hypothetical protein